MRIAFSVDAADLNGAGVLGHLRLPDRSGDFALSWHDDFNYAGLVAIKDMQPFGDDIVAIIEGAGGSRQIGRFAGGRTIESCLLLRRTNRPICLLAHGSSVLIGHVGGVSSFDPARPERAATLVRDLPDGRVVSLVEFDGRVIASVQSVERELTSLIDIESGAIYWSDERARLMSKLVVWQGRLVATDVHNAEIVVIGQDRAEAYPLHYGYVRALCPLEDGSLLIARNVWRKHYRRHGDRFRGRRLQPAWLKTSSYLQQHSSALLVVEPDGRIRTELPFSHLAWEVSAALQQPGDVTGRPDLAAHVRAIHQRDAYESLASDLRTRLRALKDMPEAES